MKKILLINGHPDEGRLCDALADSYARGAVAGGAQVQHLRIRDLQFDPNLRHGYQTRMPLEPDLTNALESIRQAAHLVWVFPVWWYGWPALMKGFIDRLFLPGLTFAYEEGRALPKGLLKGRSARLILTADSPEWYYRWYMGAPATRQLKKGTLEFCGVSPVRTTYLGPVRGAKTEKIGQWLTGLQTLGTREARQLAD